MSSLIHLGRRADFLFLNNFKEHITSRLSGYIHDTLITIEPGDATSYEFLVIQENIRWIVGSVESRWLRVIGPTGLLHPDYVQEKVDGNINTINLLCDLVNQIRGIIWEVSSFYSWRE